MHAGEVHLVDLLLKNMEIPFFQRSYVWEDENCRTLLEDIEQSIKNEQALFLGCIVLKEIKRTWIMDKDRLQLIDGQQRITTLSILLKVISLLNEDCKPEFSKFYTASQYNVKHNHYDAQAFDEVMNKNNTEKYKSNTNRIFDTFNLYVDLLKDKSSEELKFLYGYTTNSIQVILVTVDANEDEQKIFDSLNSLGVRLTTAELLKNYLFNSKDTSDVKLFEEGWIDDNGKHHDGWKSCFEKDKDTKGYWDAEITHGRIKRSNIDLLLHSFLSMQSTSSNGVYSKLDDLFNSYKIFLKDKDIQFKHRVIQEICTLSEVYKKYINYDVANIAPKTNIERLNLLLFAGELTTVIPYFVFLLSNYNENSKELDEVCRYLEGYLLRRFVTGTTAKNYNNFFASLVREKVDSVQGFIAKVRDKKETNGIPSDEAIMDKICETEFSTNDKPKIILYLLEALLNNDKTTLPLGEYGRYELEHIMPKKWEEHWGEVNKGIDPYIVRQHVLNIGNMTLLTSPLNKEIKNESWTIKVNGQTKNNKKYDGYKEHVKGIHIFGEKYLQQDEWDIQTIDSRAKELAGLIVNNWPL